MDDYKKLRDELLTGVDVVGSTVTAALSVSGGTLTGSTVSLGGGFATLDGSCTLVNSPVSITAATLSASQCEMRSDGTTVPLAVESGGSVTLTGVVFRSTAGDITAVSVSDGGNLTVGESQLIAQRCRLREPKQWATSWFASKPASR